MILLLFINVIVLLRNWQEREKLPETLHLRLTCRLISLQIINLIISISKYHSNLSQLHKNSQTLNTKVKIIYITALLFPELNIYPSYTRYFKYTQLIKIPKHSTLYQIWGMHFGFGF